MRLILLLFSFLPILTIGQELNYFPNNLVEVTVGKSYYDTEYIYIKNNSDQPLTPQFELVKNNFPSAWHETACTNQQCYTDIPKFGTLGTLQVGEQGFFSINMSANDKIGAGEIIYLITDPNNTSIKDSIKFRYAVTESGKVTALPWANIVFKNGILTVLLQDTFLETTVLLSTLGGQIIYNQQINQILSLPLYEYPNGIYLLKIEDEKGRILTQTIANF